MTLEILNLVLALCQGAPNKQACHKGYAKCLHVKKLVQRSRAEICHKGQFGPNKVTFEECMEKSGGQRQQDAELLGECVKD